MGYTHGTPASAKEKVCTCCGNLLPNTNEYFGWANKKDGRLNAVCKKCVSEKSKKKNAELREKNKDLSLFYEGTRKCKHCGRELPNNKLYFSIDLTCKDGLRNVCRECNPKEAGFLDENYKKPEKWTDEEIELLKQVYNNYTSREIEENNFFPNRTIRAVECQAGILGINNKTEETKARSRESQSALVSEKMKGRIISEEARQKSSATKKEYFKTHNGWWKGKKRSEEQCRQISERMKGKWAGDKNPRHINPLKGSANGRWKGGVLTTYQELRSDTKEWQNESMDFCNYKCVITGGDFDNIHHTTPFRNIVDEVFENTQIAVCENVSDYSTEDFNVLREELKKLHSYYGYGACVEYNVHKLFHDNYGYTKTTPYDFLDFIYRIDIGEFDNWFEENNLKININYEYVEYLESTLLLMSA